MRLEPVDSVDLPLRAEGQVSLESAVSTHVFRVVDMPVVEQGLSEGVRKGFKTKGGLV